MIIVISLHLPLTFRSVAATRLKQLKIITVLKIRSELQVGFLIFAAIFLCEPTLMFVVYHFQYTSLGSSFAYKVDYRLSGVPQSVHISSLPRGGNGKRPKINTLIYFHANSILFWGSANRESEKAKLIHFSKSL